MRIQIKMSLLHASNDINNRRKKFWFSSLFLPLEKENMTRPNMKGKNRT
jgi:hypothetical protein